MGWWEGRNIVELVRRDTRWIEWIDTLLKSCFCFILPLSPLLPGQHFKQNKTSKPSLKSFKLLCRPCIQTQNFGQQKSLPCVGRMVWKLFRNHSCGRPVKLFYSTARCTVTKPRNALFFFEWCTSKSQLTKNSFTLKDDDVLTRCCEFGKLAHHRFLLLSIYYLPEEIEGSLLTVCCTAKIPVSGAIRCSRETVGLLTYWHSTPGLGGNPITLKEYPPKKNLEDRPHSETKTRMNIL